MYHTTLTSVSSGRRLTRLVAAVVAVALTTADVRAQPAVDTTVSPPRPAPATSGSAAPLSPPAGVLDPTFDTDGMITTGIGYSNPFSEEGTAVAIQGDGKIVAAGLAFNGSDSDYALVRYDSGGSLDTSFDGDGKVTTPVGFFNDRALAVAIQSDGKIVVAGQTSNVVSYADFALVRYNSDGSLDTTFDADGKVTTDMGSWYDDAYALAIQSNGKIVVAGSARTGSNDNFALARYNIDGSLDTTFDTDGRVTTDIGSSIDHAYAVAIQSDGMIVAAGPARIGGNWDFALARYNSNGTLDASFDGDGKVTTDILSSADLAYAVAIQSDGKIVAAGSSDNGSNDDFALVRYNSNGSLDITFDGDGKVTTDFWGYYDKAYAATIQSDGKILAVGSTFPGSNDDFALTRYNSDGSPDPTFGKVTTDILGSYDEASAVAVQSDGKIVAAGRADNGSNYDFALARYHSTGSLDVSFGSGGKVTTGIDYSNQFSEIGSAMAIQSDGKIVAAGQVDTGNDYDFVLARYNSNGALDTSFDGDGMVTTDFGSSDDDQANAVAIQNDGKIVAAGQARIGGSWDFALTRYNNDGSLDVTFDSDGRVTTDIGGWTDSAFAVAIQSNGKIVVAGYVNNGSDNDFALARYNSDGSPDTTFDGDGKVTTDFGGYFDEAYALAIRSDGKIVVAGFADNGSDNDFALARYNSNGSLDASFDGDGKVTTAAGASYDTAYAVVIQSDGKVVAAGDADNGSDNDFALVRYNSNGTLDATFDSDGKVTTDFGAGYDRAYAVITQSDGKIVAAGSADNGSNSDFALARYNSDGSLDTTFDGDGKVTTDFGVGYDGAYAVITQRDGKIVAAGSADNGSNFDLALARYQVASTSSQLIANNGSATLEDVTITNHSGGPCTLTVTKYPTPPGGGPADSGEMPVHQHVSTDCTTYNFDLVFNYTDVELLFGNNVTESNLQAYRSTNGSDFSLAGGTVNASANTVAVTGVTELSWWGLSSAIPASIILADFTVVQQGDELLVTWETVSELDNLGFNLYRGGDSQEPDRQLNATLIPSQAPGSPGGFSYTWPDRAALSPGFTYYYWVGDVDFSGATTMHGPVSADFNVPTAVTLTELRVAVGHVTGGELSDSVARALIWMLALLAGGLAVWLWRTIRRGRTGSPSP